jgi:uncharacterized protein
MNTAIISSVVTLARLRELRGDILRIAERHGVKNIRVFGSVARGEATATSDVDLLLELEAKRSLFDLSGFKIDMEDLLGCRVDVATPAAIDPRMKERIYADAKSLC